MSLVSLKYPVSQFSLADVGIKYEFIALAEKTRDYLKEEWNFRSSDMFCSKLQLLFLRSLVERDSMTAKYFYEILMHFGQGMVFS